MSDSWGYAPHDTNYKSVKTLLDQLISCAALGGNYLLNVAPLPDGSLPVPATERLTAIGEWMAYHAEAVRGTERLLPDWWDYTSTARITTRGNNAYLLASYLPGAGREMVLTTLRNPVLSAQVMATGQALTVRRDGRRTILSGFPADVTPSAPIRGIRLTLAEPATPNRFHANLFPNMF